MSGEIYTQMVMHMMLSHMCEEPYWLLRKTFLIQLVVSFLLVIGVVPWVCCHLALGARETIRIVC